MKFDLASAPVGEPPDGFSGGLTGQGEAVRWQVIEDISAAGGKVIAETSRDTADYRFPLCIYDGAIERDVEVSVLFKPVAGELDQAGGVIARARDAQNYYVVRANALEANVRLYKVTDGVRRQLAGHNGEVQSGVWHRLSLKVIDDRLEATFDGALVLSVRDQTLSEPGKAGLWTKADSLTHFAELEIRTISGEVGEQRT
jgi:hypothetical protein